MPVQVNDIDARPSRDLAIYRQVACLHMDGINQGFLPQLGLGFMTLLYEAIDHCPSSVLLTEINKGQVVGFVSGTASMKPIYKQLLRKPAHLIVALMPSLVRPRRLKRIFEILRYSRQANNENTAEPPAFELLSIVVAPTARGTGCADRLYGGLIEYCERESIDGFKIVVGDALAPAQRFYQRIGAKPAGRVEVHAGEGSVIYVHKIALKQEITE